MEGTYCHNQLLRIFSGSWELGRGRIIQWSLPEGRRQAFGNLVSWEKSCEQYRNNDLLKLKESKSVFKTGASTPFGGWG